MHGGIGALTPCFDPDPKLKWLIAATHPDDEMAVAAWIRRLTNQGNEVWMSWTHHTPIREAEARIVAKMLGVAQENLVFHGGTDGQCPEEMAQLLPKFRGMIEKIQPDRVVVGAFEQGHRDHDATNCLIHAAGARNILEFPLYHNFLTRLQTINRFSNPEGEEILDLSPDEWQLKRGLPRQYPSQNIRNVLVWYSRWQRLKLNFEKLERTERLRWQTHFDFGRPNAPPALAHKIEASPAWRTWLDALTSFRKLEAER